MSGNKESRKTPLVVLPTAKGVLIWIVISKNHSLSFSNPKTTGLQE